MCRSPVAAKLYEAGWTLVQLGTRYGVSPNAVRRKLVEVGVRMRVRDRSNPKL